MSSSRRWLGSAVARSERRALLCGSWVASRALGRALWGKEPTVERQSPARREARGWRDLAPDGRAAPDDGLVHSSCAFVTSRSNVRRNAQRCAPERTFLMTQTLLIIDACTDEMKGYRRLDLSRYGFELFDTPIEAARSGDNRLLAKAEVWKGIIVSGPEQKQRSPRLVANVWLTVTRSGGAA